MQGIKHILRKLRTVTLTVLLLKSTRIRICTSVTLPDWRQNIWKWKKMEENQHTLLLPIMLLSCQQPHQHHGVMHKSGKSGLEQTWWDGYRGVDCSLLSCLHALRCIFCSTLTPVIFSPNPHWLKWHRSRQFVLFLAAPSGAAKDDTVQPRSTKLQTNFTASFKSNNVTVGWDTYADVCGVNVRRGSCTTSHYIRFYLRQQLLLVKLPPRVILNMLRFILNVLNKRM